MKTLKNLAVTALTVLALALPLAVLAADSPKKPDLKPYKLDKCIVTDEKLGEMGKPVVYDYKGQEIKFCCKSCRKDFDKDPAKFMKKLQEEEKKAEAGQKPKTAK
jgi:YHS domain-containing protein